MIYICAIIKDEHRYLKEWLDYHFELGIDQIILYEDGGESHYDIIKPYGDKVILKNAKEVGTVMSHSLLQITTYTHWFRKMEYYSYCFFIDIDEFIVFENGYTLNELCQYMADNELEDFPLFWRMYNANGHIKRPEGKQMDVYTKESNVYHFTIRPYSQNSKTFAYKLPDKKSYYFISIHHLIHRSENELKEFYDSYKDKIRLNHYYTRSYEDWCEKKSKDCFMDKERLNSDDRFFLHNPELKGKI